MGAKKRSPLRFFPFPQLEQKKTLIKEVPVGLGREPPSRISILKLQDELDLKITEVILNVTSLQEVTFFMD
jgi:hypothetical protein